MEAQKLMENMLLANDPFMGPKSKRIITNTTMNYIYVILCDD
jgi:hypothetical protein